LLLSVALAQVLQPLDFDHTKLRNIWESPELQPALKNLSPKLAAEVSRGGRILNGTRASAGQFPYHVLLVIDNSWWCGGSLIKSNWILTAAHCVYERFQVTAYSIVDLNVGYYWTGSSSRLFVHEYYDDYNIVNDVALVKLSTSAPTTSYTSTINLPRSSNLFAGSTATAHGFGKYNDASDVSDFLRYVSVSVLSNSACNSYWGISSGHICIDTSSGRGVCSGDSGGGLVYGSGTAREVIGVASFVSGYGCEHRVPHVFARVSSFVSWIDAKIAAN
jgi:secreted trypsin-like serine protease